MAFNLTPGAAFVAGVTTIPATVANEWRVNISRALDALNGGNYTNDTLIKWLTGSAGMQFDSFLKVGDGGIFDLLSGAIARVQTGGLVDFTTGGDGRVAPGSFRIPGVENGSMVVSASGAYIATVTGTFSGVVTGGSASVSIWTTPSRPYSIETATIQITGDGLASVTPGSVQLKLQVNSVDIISGITPSWGGTTYSVNPAISPSNLVFFGLDTADRSDLLTGAFSDNGLAARGAQGGDGVFAAYAAGGAGGFWGKVISLMVLPGVDPVTFTAIPYRVTLTGHLI